jgi:hypothetical protein
MPQDRPDPGLIIWDNIRGHRPASAQEVREIFRQASRILARYYDKRTFCRITPWHHAAGDFIVRVRPGGNVEVRLTTARSYEPLPFLKDSENLNPMIPLVYFFLDVTVRMRLDRLDGVGELVWAPSMVIPYVLEGLFQGLGENDTAPGRNTGGLGDLQALLRSFKEAELAKLFDPLLDFYEKEDPAPAFSLIRHHLKAHAQEIHQALQAFPG